MRRKLFTICLLMLTFSFAKSQPDSPLAKSDDNKTFLIHLQNGQKSDFGYLAAINDSALQLSHKRVKFSNSVKEDSSFKTYNYQNIESLGIGKYGQVGRGFLTGALVGFGTGGLTGIAMAGGFIDAADIIILGVIGAIPGTIIGGLLGSHKKKFNIKRNKENFHAMKNSVLEMALSSESQIIKDSTSSK